MTRDCTPPRRHLGAVRLGATALVLAILAWVGPSSGAQTPEVQPCTVGGVDCLTAQQQQQVARIRDELTGRRAGAQASVAAVADAYVDYWVAYATQLGYAIAYSYLPG